jgi:hypothetical protein
MFPMHARALLKHLQDVQAATMWLYSTASAQLTTPVHGYSGDMTRQYGITGRTMFSAVER